MRLIPFRFKLWLFKCLLRTQGIYDIAGGLRGPDYDYTTSYDVSILVKNITTAVIRHGMNLQVGVVCHGLDRAKLYWAVASSETRAAAVQWRLNHDHFFRHVLSATQNLGEPGKELLEWLDQLRKENA